ncbi:response regulator transcription factor [Dyadobacter diqingensis]|uniref:response regulator transcription factor n=1 Tax=Dyadobacter diqingensis TaxID=2938121 RepID=UPI0020C1A135|nr:response regulator transcription factor [Dyadobacter diqingensis]
METIAIIDKHPIVRAGLDIFIKTNFNEVSIHEFESFYHFNKAGFKDYPDLFIVGNTVELPSTQCKFIMELQLENHPPKFIIYDEDPDFLKVSLYFKSGVTGYLTKQSDMDELLKCIRDVQNEKNYISNEVLDVLLPKWVSPGDDSAPKNEITLTHREFEIANFLINGCSVSQISKKLQRKASTISTIKKSLFRKLKITTLVDLKDSLQKSIHRQIG